MAQRKKAGVSPKTIKWIWGVVFAPFALLAVMLLLTALGLFGRMPSFEELENPRSNLATEIYSEDGKVIGSFFVQNRSYVQYEDLFPADSAFHIRLDGHDMPPIVAALIATEDARFRTHSGIDIPSLARVAVKTVLLQNTSRNLVLSRMEDAGALTRKERDSISALPIVLNYKPVSHNEGTATYFREMLRLVMNAERPKRNQFYTEWDYDQAVKEYEENPLYGWCRKNRKADGTPYNIYRDGLKIYTTVNSTMQKYAEQAVQKQMQSVIQPRMDAQYRNTKTLFIDATREERERIMRHAIRYSDRYREMEDAGASAKQIMAAFDKPCSMKVFTYRGERDTLMTPRDSILHHKRIMRASFVALDPRTGYVKAYVGGPNFRYFKYDMAKQGKRQIGSTIKPFVYTFAIDHLGLTPCTMVPNLPVTIETANGTAWSPKEAGKVEYDGVMHPLRWGLARSRNNYSAWIMKQAKQPAAVADFIHNMGIRSFIDPVPALCLGSSESNVFELVSAFSTFANEGVHTDPIFVTRIEDRQGNVIANFIPPSQDAVSERTAYTMLTMLQDVVNSGTAGRLKWQFGLNDMEIGGKTGTSNKNRDAWFMCVAPKLVAGAWVGGEDQAVHFVAGGEGSVMALPIVGDFMKRVYDDGRLGVSRADQFIRPAMMPRYDCDEEVDPDERPTEPGIAEDDNFFD